MSVISMEKSNDLPLRKILSRNIKKARATLDITQIKLAERSEISAAHIIEIEQCKTWVSDKALAKIAKALNKEVYELLVPEIKGKHAEKEQEDIKRASDLIKAKKSHARKRVLQAMDDLILETIGV